MPRKRTSKNPTSENPGVAAEAPPAQVPVAQFAPAEPPAAEPTANGQSHAERVGQKQWTPAPDPFGIAKDNLAGVRLFESKQDRQVAIKFEDKPSQTVIDRMKEAGFQWKPADRIWAKPVRGDTAVTTRIDAEKLFQEVSQTIRQEKGIEAGKSVPF
jgi:hypothetical protein